MREKFPTLQFEKPKSLDTLLSEAAERANKKLSKSFGEEPVVDEACSVRAESFSRHHGGPHRDEWISEDEEYVFQKKKEWAGVYSENTRAWYEERGITSEEAMVADWEKRQEKQMHSRFEKYATVLFNTMLSGKFLFLRTNAADDIKRSVDNFIIDEETGNVVCAFDSVNYTKPHDEYTKDRKAEKMDRVRRSIVRGGSSVKYGLGFHDGKYEKKQLNHLPLFYVSLDNDEARTAIDRLESSGGAITDAERQIFEKFIYSFEEQITAIENEPMSDGMKKSVAMFRDALIRMRDKANMYKLAA